MEQQRQNEEIEIDLQELFFALLDRIWAIVLTALIGAAVAGIITTTALTPMYSSSTMIYIKNQEANLSSLSMADLQVSSELTSDYMVLVTSRPVVNKVISNLELDMEYKEFVAQVSVNNPSNTRILTITVQNEDPYMAKTIVDDLTKVMISRTAEIMDTTEPSIVEEGTVNEEPVSPSLKKNVVIGGMIGFLLAAALIVIRYLMNDSIKTSEDVERYLGLNTLGTIPMEEGKSKKEEKKQERRNHKRRMKNKRKKGAA
ncbi:MAG: polysaccharide export protein [Lachnospiraceae bacterium]|nr:polysaccharide export protein [Lachnospiraceae bacterium]